MSSKYSKPVLSRPRTKVYDSSYNIGESYYKSALDGLDRKYGRPGSGYGEFGFSAPTTQSIFDRPTAQEPQSSRIDLKQIEDDFFRNGRNRTSNPSRDFDLDFEGRPRTTGNRFGEDAFDSEQASFANRSKTVRFSRSMADDSLEDSKTPRLEKSRMNEARARSKMNFSDKVMDSVGLTERARSILEDEGMIGKRRSLRMASDFGGPEELTKWTALKPTPPRRYLLEEDDERSFSEAEAAARARKSRARLEDLESEMRDLSERSAAREKRVRDLKALVQENEASSMDNFQTAVRINSSIESEKNVTF